MQVNTVNTDHHYVGAIMNTKLKLIDINEYL